MTQNCGTVISMGKMDDRERLILLNLVPDIGSLRATRLLEAFGTFGAIFDAPTQRLQQVEGIGPALAKRIASYRRKQSLVDDEMRDAKRAGCEIVTRLEDAFPAPLMQIPDPPLALYMKGHWTPGDQTAVAIVGSRRASLYGAQIAERLAYDLAIRGVTIVSGLARGIDASAHRGALKAHGRTLAVLGNGLASIYPPEHRELAEEVIKHGAVLSEYPMTMEPLAQNFPRRNRLISGLSLGVVIVEAAKRSGALITADMALEQGREVFAVPGKVDSLTSHGTHQLLKQGARLVTSVEDILDELRLEPVDAAVGAGQPAFATSPPRRLPTMTEDEDALLAQLSADEAVDVDTLSRGTGLTVAVCCATLLSLELKHVVRQLPGKRFVKV